MIMVQVVYGISICRSSILLPRFLEISIQFPYIYPEILLKSEIVRRYGPIFVLYFMYK